MFVPLAVFYVSEALVCNTDIQYLVGAFFTRTTREIKRVDSNLRSHLYAHFGEQVALESGESDTAGARVISHQSVPAADTLREDLPGS